MENLEQIAKTVCPFCGTVLRIGISHSCQDSERDAFYELNTERRGLACTLRKRENEDEHENWCRENGITPFNDEHKYHIDGEPVLKKEGI